MGLRETLQMQMQEQQPYQLYNPETNIEALQTLRLQNSELQLSNQNLLLEMESAAQQIMELTAKLESTAQTIQTLQSQNSEVLSENQNLLSQMMSASEQIELLTNRAATVSLVEQENQKLREEAEIFRNAADKAETTASDAADREKSEKQRRIETERKNEEERHERLKAQDLSIKAESQIKRTQDKYRCTFIGIAILTMTLAVLIAYDRRSIFTECGQWFIDRWENIVQIGKSLHDLYLTGFGLISGKLPDLAIEWHYILTSVAAFLLTIFVLILFRLLHSHTWKVRRFFSRKIRDALRNELRVIICISVSICLFYCCVFFRERIACILPMNIMTIWLILSVSSAFAVLLPGIIGKH